MRQRGRHKSAILLTVPVALLVAAAIIVGPAVQAASGQHHAAPTSTSPQLSGGVGTGCGSWSIIPSANPSATFARLNGVAAVPGTNTAWAVGSAGESIDTHQPLVERWDGTSWSVVPTPAVPLATFAELHSVTALSSIDVWAVGDYHLSGAAKPLIEHWDGTSWSIVPSPSVLAGILFGVTALSSTDVWAVGGYAPVDFGQGLAEHWDGTSWSIVPMQLPTVEPFDQPFYSVSAVSPTDVWAVGYATFLTARSSFDVSQIEHWNGMNWSLVASPNPLPPEDHLTGVVALSASNAWAVGSAGFTGSGGDQRITFVVHWNGMNWSTVSSSSPDSLNNVLNGIAAVSGNELWAVGDTANPFVFSPQQGQTLVERWDGAQWRLMPSQNPVPQGAGADLLLGVAATPLRTLWAVGYTHTTSTNVDQTLIEHSPSRLGLACHG